MVRWYSHFEDAEYAPDPIPRDKECSSVEDDDNSDDDETEELYTDPSAPARGRVRECRKSRDCYT